VLVLFTGIHGHEKCEMKAFTPLVVLSPVKDGGFASYIYITYWSHISLNSTLFSMNEYAQVE